MLALSWDVVMIIQKPMVSKGLSRTGKLKRDLCTFSQTPLLEFRQHKQQDIGYKTKLRHGNDLID